MNKTEFRSKVLYPAYCFVKRAIGSPLHLPVDYTGMRANEEIRKLLSSENPAMIARLGGTECRAMLGYFNGRDLTTLQKIAARCQLQPVGFPEKIRWMMFNYSGFFPATPEMLARFGELMQQDMKNLDMLGVWRPEEIRMRHFMPEKLSTVDLAALDSWDYPEPWTNLLAYRKVLVVHPFKDSIEAQYRKREKLFRNPAILPEFDLQVVRAVQSLGHKPEGFGTWFDALNSMKDEISARDFDIALIGAGAYGFPLAAHVKRMGKKAVHLGGSLQMLFGIYGSRWQDSPLINEYWIRPSKAETPDNCGKVENATYW